MAGAVDRSWMFGAEEEVSADLRTRRALDEVMDQRAAEARARIARAKAERRRKMAEPVTLEKLWPISHWAEMLGFEENTIRECCKSGEIKGEKLRGQWRIGESAIREFLANERKRNAS